MQTDVYIHRSVAMYVEGKINSMLVTMETEKVVQLVPFKQTPYACVLIEHTVYKDSELHSFGRKKHSGKTLAKKVV
jgi:hypothetical protein